MASIVDSIVDYGYTCGLSYGIAMASASVYTWSLLLELSVCRLFYLCAGVEPQAANTVEYMQRHDLGLDVDLGVVLGAM